MRVLVTGGAGFIGSHIVGRLIDSGHEPFVVDDLSSGHRSNLPADVPLFEVDVRDNDALGRAFDEARPEAVCHQAAQLSVSRSVREPVFDAEVNVRGLIQTLEHSVRCGAQRFVFASSGGVLYGNVFDPAAEDMPANPISPYGISKWAGERYLQFFAREHDLTTVALRYSNVYGPRQDPHGEAGVVAIFSQLMLAAKDSTINGDGSIVRDYVFVEDVARANQLALTTSSLPESFVPMNIGTGVPTDLMQLSTTIRNLCQQHLDQIDATVQVPIPSHGPPRAGDLQSNLISPARAEEILGWRPEVSVATGLQATVSWFAEQHLAKGEKVAR